MIPEYQKLIAIRISYTTNTKIISLVKEGSYRSASDLVRAALQEFLFKEKVEGNIQQVPPCDVPRQPGTPTQIEVSSA